MKYSALKKKVQYDDGPRGGVWVLGEGTTHDSRRKERSLSRDFPKFEHSSPLQQHQQHTWNSILCGAFYFITYYNMCRIKRLKCPQCELNNASPAHPHVYMPCTDLTDWLSLKTPEPGMPLLCRMIAPDMRGHKVKASCYSHRSDIGKLFVNATRVLGHSNYT